MHDPQATQEETGASTGRILVVDDSFLMRRVIRNIVEQDESMEVVAEAADGMEALSQVAALDPDLIVLDIEMPRMDGIEFLREARLLTTARIVVISSVARLGSPEAMEVMEMGVVDIIPKPSGVISMDLEDKKSHEVLDVLRQSLRDKR